MYTYSFLPQWRLNFSVSQWRIPDKGWRGIQIFFTMFWSMTWYQFLCVQFADVQLERNGFTLEVNYPQPWCRISKHSFLNVLNSESVFEEKNEKHSWIRPGTISENALLLFPVHVDLPTAKENVSQICSVLRRDRVLFFSLPFSCCSGTAWPLTQILGIFFSFDPDDFSVYSTAVYRKRNHLVGVLLDVHLDGIPGEENTQEQDA